MSNNWTTNEIPDLIGKVAIVTGANSGIGYETAKALAEKGATVVMACRNRDKARAAVENIQRDVPNAQLPIIRLDLADLESVLDFAAQFESRYDRLDLLINNAGVMIPPYTRTRDGFELQFGANHLGHFALTGLLMDTLLDTPGSRIVNVSSSAHRMGSGTIEFDNLNAEKGYSASGAYSQSKLANLLTSLQRGLMLAASRVLGQSPPMGALPTLRAAVAADVQPDDYYGPGGFKEIRGYPKKVDTSDAAKDTELAERLWQVSEELTGVSYSWTDTIQVKEQSE